MPTRMTRDVRKVVEALATTYDHEVNDEMGNTWCRFCEADGPDMRYTPPTHQADCVVLLARRLIAPPTT